MESEQERETKQSTYNKYSLYQRQHKNKLHEYELITENFLPRAKTEHSLHRRQRWIYRKQNSKIYLSDAAALISEAHQKPISGLTCPTMSNSSMPYWWPSENYLKIEKPHKWSNKFNYYDNKQVEACMK